MSLPIEKEFEILHVSSRPGRTHHPGDEVDSAYDYRWFRYNLVFRAIGTEFRDRCFDETREHRKTRIYTDPDLHEKYIRNLRMINEDTGKDLFGFNETEEEKEKYKDGIPISVVNTLGIERDDVYITGYETVFNPILIHIEKFDVFRFWGYFMDCPATQGICSTIYNLSKGINGCRVTDSHMFLTCLKTLDYFWD